MVEKTDVLCVWEQTLLLLEAKPRSRKEAPRFQGRRLLAACVSISLVNVSSHGDSRRSGSNNELSGGTALTPEASQQVDSGGQMDHNGGLKTHTHTHSHTRDRRLLLFSVCVWWDRTEPLVCSSSHA